MIDSAYHWLKAFHLIAVIAWMAGMLYLPRLFVYHAQVAPGSAESELFKVMERRLLRAIMNPAMAVAIILGFFLAVKINAFNPATNGFWMHAKFAAVLALAGMHGMMSAHRKRFARDANVKSARYYKIFNEIITLLLIFIVILVVVKPF